MKKPVRNLVVGAIVLLLPLAGTPVSAATLNPEGVNPHQEGRKKITQEQKKKAAEARKQGSGQPVHKKSHRAKKNLPGDRPQGN